MSDPIAHGYDWAWAQIGGESVKSNGGTFVVRYLGGSARLTPQERDNLHADGVNILLVMEQEADIAEKGYGRGAQAAAQANAEADALGYPADCMLLYADDNNDPDPAQEVDFMHGVHDEGGRVPDMYSGGNVLVAVNAEGLSAYGGWMVETWFPHLGANPFMIQLANTRDPAMVDVDEGSYDTNLLYRSVPMWGPNGTTGGHKPPVQRPREDDMTVWLCLDTSQPDVAGAWVQEGPFMLIFRPNTNLVGPGRSVVVDAPTMRLIRDDVVKARLAAGIR